MNDLPDNAIEVDQADMGNLNIYEKVANLIESGHRIVAIPVAEPEPRTLAERMERWQGYWDEMLDPHPVHPGDFYAAMVHDLGLVRRDDTQTETLQPLDNGKVWSAIRTSLDRIDHVKLGAAKGERYHALLDAHAAGIANDVSAKFGAPSVPTVTQVMEALGFAWSDVDSLGRTAHFAWRFGNIQMKPENAEGFLTAIGIRPDTQPTQTDHQHKESNKQQ